MDATTPLNPEAQRKQDRARKRKAILAGGVVLGLGAAVTLAAWSDDVFANGTFNTGQFELQGNVTTTNLTAPFTDTDGWDVYDSAPGGELRFDQALTGGTTIELQPNEEVFAPITLRLSPDTTIGGTFVLSEVGFATGFDTDLSGNIAYRVIDGTTATDCNAQTPIGSDWANGTVVGTGPTAPTTIGTALPLLAAAADSDELCLGVTLTANTDAVKAADDTTITWRFTATADTTP